MNIIYKITLASNLELEFNLLILCGKNETHFCHARLHPLSQIQFSVFTLGKNSNSTLVATLDPEQVL